MTTDDQWHVKVNSSKRADLYAVPPKGSLWEDSPCGCQLAPCGFVIPNDDCKWHGKRPAVKIAKGHFARNCPGGPH